MNLSALRGFDAPVYVIAEAGVNHGGDLQTALRMVDAAARAGVDAIKFQTYKAERLATRSSAAYWDRSEEASATQFELFRKYDALGERDYRELAAACREAGIAFLSTPFDVESAAWLAELMPAFKVASADLTNEPLLAAIAATRKPVLLSTGASTLAEVQEAVETLRAAGCGELALLHCSLAYPTAAADAALGALVDLRRAFPDVVLGYSDHTRPVDSVLAIPAAVALGARIVEKHFTLDASQPGNDHYHAFEPEQFAALREQLDRLHAMLGRDEKVVLAAEEPARLHARRSVVARVAIAAGMEITAEMLDVKRPGTGIDPRELGAVVGMRAAREIAEDTTLTWEMLVSEQTVGAR